MENIFSSKMISKSTGELEEIVNSENQYVDKAILAALWELKKRNQLSKSNSVKLNLKEIDEFAEKKQKETAKRLKKVELKESLKFYFNFFTFRTHSKIVPIIIYLNIIIYGLMMIKGVHPMKPSPFELINWGGNLSELSLNAQPWRLVSYIFLHGSIIHILFNLVVLGFIGPIAEITLGRKLFLLSYLITGIGSGIISALWNINLVSVGASGSIFGLFGVMLSVIILSKEKGLKKEFVPSILIFIGYNIMYGLTNKGIDNAGHLGGLLTGIFVGVIIRFTSLRNSSILDKLTKADLE